jgi:hypothetical protein
VCCHMLWDIHIEVPNSQRISCLDSSLGMVPACDAGNPGLIPGGGKLNVCLQGALLEDRDDPGQVSLLVHFFESAFSVMTLSWKLQAAAITYSHSSSAVPVLVLYYPPHCSTIRYRTGYGVVHYTLVQGVISPKLSILLPFVNLFRKRNRF